MAPPPRSPRARDRGHPQLLRESLLRSLPPAVIHLNGKSENSTRWGLHMEEGSAKNLPEGTKGGPRGPGIGQFFAFTMSLTRERPGGGGLMVWLLSFLMNRSGTRIGRFTWPSFGLWALVFILAGVMPPSYRDALSPFLLGLWFLGYPILLLNRLDTSGPTREEFERVRENWLSRKKRNAPK